MHLPLRLQTTSRSGRKHHSEELARTQTRGLEEGIESPGVKPHIRGQFMNIKNWEWAKRKGQSSQETVRGKLATYTEEHHWSSSRSSKRNLTENTLFCTWNSPPPTPSPLRWTSGQHSAGHRKCLLCPHFSLLQPPCWGTEASPLLSAWRQPHYPEARALTALRIESSRQLVTEPSLKAKSPAPAGRRGLWRPLRAAGAEWASLRSHSPEGSPRSSSAASA